jgi:DNA-binding NarL/FixJ family response regulator
MLDNILQGVNFSKFALCASILRQNADDPLAPKELCMPTQVAIACRHQLFADGICKLLEGANEIAIVGVARTGPELNEMLRKPVDVILVEGQVFDRELAAIDSRQGLRFLLMDDYRASYGDLQQLVSRGICGFLGSDMDAEMLRKAIVQVASGELWIDHKTIRESLVATPKNCVVRLTRKETEVLQCLYAGFSNKEAARKLCVSEQTIKSHYNHLFKKFGVSNRLKLALHAAEVLPRPVDSVR